MRWRMARRDTGILYELMNFIGTATHVWFYGKIIVFFRKIYYAQDLKILKMYHAHCTLSKICCTFYSDTCIATHRARDRILFNLQNRNYKHWLFYTDIYVINISRFRILMKFSLIFAVCNLTFRFGLIVYVHKIQLRKCKSTYVVIDVEVKYIKRYA